MLMTKKNQISSLLWDDLTEDLILEILSHLPPITLIRFKSVSKSLNSLISNPDFLSRYAVHQFRRQDPSPPPPGILLKRQDLSGDSKILIFPPPPGDGDGDYDDNVYGHCSSQLRQNLIHYRPEHEHDHDQLEKVKYTVIDSCNGLLLHLNCVRHVNPPGGKCIWYVCNPITKHYIKLPTFEEQGFTILEYSSANIVFDPSLSLTYKVVIWLRCRYQSLQEHFRLYVYSSETRSWRLSVSRNDYDIPVLRKQFSFELRAVLLKGVLYWSSLVVPLDVALCYDVEKDFVWTLILPKMGVEYAYRTLFYFGVCGGGLRLIEKFIKWEDNDYRGNSFPSIFDVMEMNQLQLQQQQLENQNQDNNDNGESLWTVKYRVNIGEGYYADLVRQKSMHGVFILDLYKTTMQMQAGVEEEEEEQVLLCICDILIIPFNLFNNTFGKELRNGKRLTDRVFTYTDVLRYAITLFPLHSLDY